MLQKNECLICRWKLTENQQCGICSQKQRLLNRMSHQTVTQGNRLQNRFSIQDMSIQEPRKSISRNTQESGFCKEHQMVMEIVCQTCWAAICYKCALFGVHKGHSHMPVQDYAEKLRKLKGAVQENQAEIDQKQDLLTQDFFYKQYQSLVQQIKEQFLQQTAQIVKEKVIWLQKQKSWLEEQFEKETWKQEQRIQVYINEQLKKQSESFKLINEFKGIVLQDHESSELSNNQQFFDLNEFESHSKGQQKYLEFLKEIQNESLKFSEELIEKIKTQTPIEISIQVSEYQLQDVSIQIFSQKNPQELQQDDQLLNDHILYESSFFTQPLQQDSSRQLYGTFYPWKSEAKPKGSFLIKKDTIQKPEHSPWNIFQTNSTNKNISSFQGEKNIIKTSIQQCLLYQMKELTLIGQGMTDENIEFLETLIKTNKKLTKINLSQNQITDAGFKSLFTLFQTDSNINTVNFSYNKLTSVSLNFLYKFVMTQENSIKEIIFTGNNIKQKNQEKAKATFDQLKIQTVFY